jgi:DNA polymerase-3 subunit delta
MPVIILAGEEEYRLSKRLAELKESLLTPAWQTMNFIRLQKPTLNSLHEAASTIAFGQGNRIVLVDNCDFFTKKRTKADSDSEQKVEAAQAKKSIKLDDELEIVLSSIPANTYLIFACPYIFDSTLKSSKTAGKYAQLEEFPSEKYFPGSRNPKLELFCRNQAKQYGATIDDAAIEYLLNSTEGDLRRLANEIEKASLTVLPQTKITYELVSNICSAQGHIFQFIDLWLSEQSSKALNNLRELLAQQNAMPILATLQTMLSKWIKIKALYEQYSGEKEKKTSPSEINKKIAADLKLMSFSIEKDLRRLQKFTAAQLVDKRLQLTRLEYAIKVGQIPADHALIMFVSSK